MQRTGRLLTPFLLLPGVLLPAGPALAQTSPTVPPPASAGTITGARAAAPVVLTGSQIAGWSGPAATGVAAAYPSGVSNGSAGAPDSGVPVPGADGIRSTHNGRLTVPPAALQTGVDPDRVAAYRWDGTRWTSIAVQVDQRFPNFLANGRSTFSPYSGTDTELTYAWKPDAHSVGEEAWKKVAGGCEARYPRADELDSPLITPGAGETRQDFLGAMGDPVPTLDDDDEIAFRAGDAGVQAPTNTPAPSGTDAGSGRMVALADPAGAGPTGFVYLFTQAGGTTFTYATGHVQAVRPDGADTWIDRNSFPKGSTEQLGSSNTNYGPNLLGTVCDTGPGLSSPVSSPRASTDRFPRDSWQVSTPVYRATASGRWMVRGYQVARPNSPGDYAPSLVARFKGRAFQQSPDSEVSLVGFEDEQVNWEANAGLLGWRSGPVRAIREVWGADSGTNVTKTEIYYRDADVNLFHVRVHPIPADGLYTSWSYDPDVAACYYTLVRPTCSPVDGVNDETVGNVDKVAGQPAFSDTPDPTLSSPSAVDSPEQVAGRDGSGGLVYTFEFTSATTVANATAVPYYRDDACLDDGTGDKAIPRPLPGENGTSQQVKDAYVAYWKTHGAPSTLTYADLKCDTPNDTTLPLWKRRPFAAAFGQHGVHFYVTGDSDNATLPFATTEIVGQQTRYAVPMSQPTNVALAYGQNVVTPLVPAVTSFAAAAPEPVVPEVPLPVLLPLIGVGIGAVLLRRRRTA